MSEIKLRNCPFCGGEAFIKVNAKTLNCSAVCPKCSVVMKRKFNGNEKVEELITELMIEAWNRRDGANE